MLRFFRINDPYRLLVAFLLLLTGRIVYAFWGGGLTVPEFGWLLTGERLGDGFVMYRDLYDHTGPLSALTYRLMDYVFGRVIWPHRVFSFLLVCFQASVLSLTLVRIKAFAENNYLPGLFYILFCLSVPEGGSLSPVLLSNTFIILALSQVFRRVDNQTSDELFLYAGLYLGIAVLFYLPAITFFFLLLLSLLIFTNAIPRRIFLYTYALTIPLVLAVANYYWYDAFDYFVGQYLIGGMALERRYYLDWSSFRIVGGAAFFWMVYALIQTWARGRLGNYETKILQIMLLVGVAASFSLWLDVSLQPSQIHLFIPVLAFMMTHLTLLIKKRIFRWTVPSLIVLSLVLNPYLIRDYADLSAYELEARPIPGVTGEKIMVLSDQPEGYYVDQQFCGPFLDKDLSIRQMKYLDYYETALHIYAAIDRDRPGVIIDDWGLMPRIFSRFPLLRDRYRMGSHNRYYLIRD